MYIRYGVEFSRVFLVLKLPDPHTIVLILTCKWVLREAHMNLL